MSTHHLEFLVVIPARLGSTRLPRKPLADIGGKPMVVRVAEQAKKSLAQSVVVATDSTEIQAACDEHRIECLLTSPDHSTGTDRLAEVAQLLKLPNNALVVNVQGDEPLIPPELINQVAQTLADHHECAISTVAVPIEDDTEIQNPNVVKVVLNRAGEALFFKSEHSFCPRCSDDKGYSTLTTLWVSMHIVPIFYRPTRDLEPAPPEQAEALEQLRAILEWLPYSGACCSRSSSSWCRYPRRPGKSEIPSQGLLEAP
jgi:3-deoxy-manno-octulosonate cytidylyltransferase (CMP-KDO synthetase)